MPIPEPNAPIFEHEVGGGRLTLVGLPFAGAGLVVAVGPRFLESNDSLALLHLPFGIFFLLFGIAIAFARYRVRIDSGRASIQRQWRLFVAVRTQRESLHGLQNVQVSHEIRKTKSANDSNYPVRLTFAERKSITIARPRSFAESRELGRRLAAFLKIDLFDASQRNEATLKADELDLKLQQRIRASHTKPSFPQPPANPRSKIKFDGTSLKVEIPPPGSNAQLTTAAISILAFVGIGISVVIKPILSNGETLPASLLGFTIAFLLLLGGIALTLLRKMFLLRQSILADASIVSYSHGWLFQKTTTIPSDQIDDILLARAKSHRHEATSQSGRVILIQANGRNIQIATHQSQREDEYILALLRAVVAT